VVVASQSAICLVADPCALPSVAGLVKPEKRYLDNVSRNGPFQLASRLASGAVRFNLPRRASSILAGLRPIRGDVRGTQFAASDPAKR